MVSKIAPFLVAHKPTLGTQDGLWPSLTFGWPKLTYIDTTQGYIYIWMHPSHLDECMDMVTNLIPTIMSLILNYVV
jgi:hypothetical protein